MVRLLKTVLKEDAQRVVDALNKAVHPFYKERTGLRYDYEISDRLARIYAVERNPTVGEVIQNTRLAMQKHKVARPKTKLFFLKRYSDLSGVVAPQSGKPFYATDYFDVYGPFKTLEAADNFVKEVLRKYTSAMRQAEVASWKAEGKELGKFGYL